MTTALVITLALGYVRFVRRQVVPATGGEEIRTDGQGLADLERRVRGLEQRMDDAASALGTKHQAPSTKH